MDSPSLTPEIWGNTLGSFFTIQNLRNTYLLSALHSQSNSLSVHSIDINLKPLFFYKIPKQCYDILISSNLLYSIQYVNIQQNNAKFLSAESTESRKEEINTEKESRDTDTEKEAHYAEEKEVKEHAQSAGDEDEKMTDNSGAESAGTSATSSGADASNCSDSLSSSNSINAVGVLSSAMASYRLGDEEVSFNINFHMSFNLK